MKGKGGRGERRRTSQIYVYTIYYDSLDTDTKYTGTGRFRRYSLQRYKTYNMNTYLRLISALAISDSEGSPLKVGGLVQWWGG